MGPVSSSGAISITLGKLILPLQLTAAFTGEAAGRRTVQPGGEMSSASMAGEDCHTRLGNALCELTTKVSIRRRRVQAHRLLKARARSARGSAGLAAERKVA